MDDLDIKKIQRILSYKGRQDLADLLKHSVSILDQSSTFGSRWNSTLSTFEIKSHPSMQAKIDSLLKEDIDEIKKAVMQIYPVRNDEPEIIEINFYPDFEIELIDLVETNQLERISFDYIHEQIKKCFSKVTEDDFDGAVTNARNLIESVCLFILESVTGENQDYDGNLIKLHKTVSACLNMSPGDYENESLKQILSGVFSIINGVSGLRNNFSDSHGSSPSKAMYKIDKRHSILTVNLSKTIAEYLFLSYEKFKEANP